MQMACCRSKACLGTTCEVTRILRTCVCDDKILPSPNWLCLWASPKKTCDSEEGHLQWIHWLMGEVFVWSVNDVSDMCEEEEWVRVVKEKKSNPQMQCRLAAQERPVDAVVDEFCAISLSLNSITWSTLCAAHNGKRLELMTLNA